jgi:cyclopropane fatty-acyl-phospholipid synthase-like methyltransferase
MEPTLPPTEYMRLVCGDWPDLEEVFERMGRQIARRLEALKMLEPGARLLDIGCGCGRVALHLVDSPIAAYAGFDRHAGMIEWAQSNIAARDDRFQFELVDVRSGYEEVDSNEGTISAAEFVFPYGDATFTGALAASVFTHIDLPATERYLCETARVLAPGGRLRASFFLDETTSSMDGSGWNFVISEDDLRAALARADLEAIQVDSTQSRHTWYLLGKAES